MNDKDKIVEYIIRQRVHHKRVSFNEEFEGFLEEMGLVLDERDKKR